MSASETLSDAREEFKRCGDLASLAAYLEAALDDWNEENLSERDFAAEVRTAKNLCAHKSGSPIFTTNEDYYK